MKKYRKENITYLLYLARMYKNINNACLRICAKKFNDVLNDFMQFQQNRYIKDIRQSRNQLKGQLTVTEEIGKGIISASGQSQSPKQYLFCT